MDEDLIVFSEAIRADLHSLRAKSIVIAGQTTFEKIVATDKTLRVVVTNRDGVYLFDAVTAEPLYVEVAEAVREAMAAETTEVAAA